MKQNRVRNGRLIYNRIEKPCIYSQLIYNKGGMTIQWKKTVSSISSAGNAGQLHVKELNYYIFSHHIHKLKMD